MGVLSDFFIADGSSVPQYDCGPAFPNQDRCQFKSITPLEAAGILSVLRGGGDSVEIMSEFQLLTPEDAEEWTQSIPPDFTTSLVKLTESEISAVAQRCADETADELGWSGEEFEPVFKGLSALARRAVATGRSMFLWNSL